MIEWERNRGNREGLHFAEHRETVGISVQAWDEICPEIDRWLVGLSDEAMDLGYPADENGVRVYTFAGSERFGVPPLFVAFAIDNADGVVEYLSLYVI